MSLSEVALPASHHENFELTVLGALGRNSAQLEFWPADMVSLSGRKAWSDPAVIPEVEVVYPRAPARILERL
jgi:hypothetical protein